MPFLINFSDAFFSYLRELWFSIFLGFFLSGCLHEFIPTPIIQKYLGQKGLKPIFLSSCVGAILPICCFGTLPIAVTMQRKGAALGSVLAFLITTPATSVPALLICGKLLGVSFMIYIAVVVILMGLIVGILGNIFFGKNKESASVEMSSCCETSPLPVGHSHESLEKRLERILKYSFITLPKDIGLELILGIAAASLVIVFFPIQHFIKNYLSGALGYVFSYLAGLVMYVCSTGSVPLADAFMKSGMLPGAAMVYLLIGPITSYGMIFAIRKAFGTKILIFYLSVISILSVFFGAFFSLLKAGRIY